MAGSPENPYAAPQPSSDVARTGPHSYEYKALFGRALAVTICLGLFGVCSFVAMLAGVGAGSSGQTLSEQWNAADAPMTRTDLFEMGEGLALLASAVAVSFFLPQANRNARALSGLPLRFTPASTVWWFFVPIMNVIRPFQAVREIWTASVAGREGMWVSPAWMPLWWGSWIVFNVLSRVTRFLARHGEAADGVSLVRRAVGLIAAGSLVWAVLRIAKVQAEQAAPPVRLPFGGGLP